VNAQSVQAERSEQQESGRSSPSGRLLLRMPRSLHAELARAAEQEGTSLNQFITGALASTIGWRNEDGERIAPADAGRAGARPQQTRVIAAALIANVVVVGLAAIAAIAILLLAWLG
jgi:RNA polymerase sigma-B factor